MLQPTQAVINQMARPEALESDTLADVVSIAKRIEHPHRDPQTLSAAWVRSETPSEVARRLDCALTTSTLWLEVYGYRERATGANELGLAQQIRAADDPSEVLADD